MVVALEGLCVQEDVLLPFVELSSVGDPGTAHQLTLHMCFTPTRPAATAPNVRYCGCAAQLLCRL